MQLNNTILNIGLRCAVGIMLLTAGVTKLPMHTEWTEVVMAYGILPLPLIKPYTVALPWLEAAIGSCLILGLFSRLFSLVSLPIIASFIVANATALSYSTPEWCGCFGDWITINHKGALVIDALLFIGAFLIFIQRRHFVALDSFLAHLFRHHPWHFV